MLVASMAGPDGGAPLRVMVVLALLIEGGGPEMSISY